MKIQRTCVNWLWDHRWDIYVTPAPRLRGHHRRDDGKSESQWSREIATEHFLLDKTGPPCSWVHRSWGHMHRACTRSSKSTPQLGGGGGQCAPTPNWELLGKGESVFFKSMTPSGSGQPSSNGYPCAQEYKGRQCKLKSMGYLKRGNKMLGLGVGK